MRFHTSLIALLAYSRIDEDGNYHSPHVCDMAGIGGRQTSVGVQPAIGVPGDYAGTNPYATVAAGAGGLVAGPKGVTIGKFAWVSYQYQDANNAPALVNSFFNGLGSSQITGFVPREQQGLNTTYLSDAGMIIQPGFEMVLATNGLFLAVNNDTVASTYQGTVYADLATGNILTAAKTATFTGSISAQTASFTGSITGNVLTVTVVASGLIVPGEILTGTAGGTITSGTQVLSQLTVTGTAGANLAGTYALSATEQTYTGATISGTYGLLNVSAVATGVIPIGGALTGTGGGGVTAATVITGQGTGLGNTGTYYVNLTQTVTSTASLSSTTSVSTKWVFENAALPGEICKISTWLQG